MAVTVTEGHGSEMRTCTVSRGPDEAFTNPQSSSRRNQAPTVKDTVPLMDQVLIAEATASSLNDSDGPPNSPLADDSKSQRLNGTVPAGKMMTTEEAKEHIAKIRREKGLDQGSGAFGVNVSDLTASLGILSNQLYSQSTHFLLEFIQNADDNSYLPHLLPSISFESRAGSLLISCNETGFQPENVEAICRIAHSTKKDRSKGFIGEKGIGFKSVFKIAKTVHVASNAYKFKFQRDGPLGMIAPIWSNFPLPSVDGQTQFYLYLAESKNDELEKQLRKQLRVLDGTLLLFLRNLKLISVAIDDGTHTVEGKFTKFICREDTTDHGGEMVRIFGDRKRLRRLEEDTEYLVVRHMAQDMPEEPKRRGMRTSEVVLAFPFKDDKPTFFKQKAYAFLPIRESGFRFLMQADFILIANREDLEIFNDWNEHLLWALAQCFCKAVGRFNAPGAEEVRYAWPGFLRDLPSVNADMNGFSPLSSRIINALKMQKVFETQEGNLVEPATGVFVPAAFRDNEGNFILAGHAGNTEFLVSKYEQHDSNQTVLRLLGVDIMDFNSFLQILTSFIANDFETYKAKPLSWHSTLAQILLDHASPVDLKALPLIQLMDGRWLKAIDGKCHFETTDAKAGLEKLPEGIQDLRIVHHQVGEDAVRRKLLETKLGVKNLDRIEVCRLLVDFHARPDAPSNLSLEALIDHAVYLFEISREGRTIPKAKQFWVYDCMGNLRRAHSLYHDFPTDGLPRVCDVLPKERWGSLLLHPGYALQYVGKNTEKWKKWLESSANVRSHLQLLDSTGKFSSEFQYIVENERSPIMLELIAASCLKEPSTYSSTTFKQMIGAIKVTCTNGLTSSLNKTCLPTAELKSNAAPGIPFVDLNNPSSSKWKCLREFGVVIKPNLDFYLRCLSLVQGQQVTRNQIVGLYGRIEAFLTEGPFLVRDFFKTNAAIYVPFVKTWHSAPQCCWEPTPGVAGELALASSYPELYSFFYDHLQVRSATIDKVTSQLLSLSQPAQPGDLELRKLLIIALSDFVRKKPDSFGRVREKLEDKPVVPIAGKHGLESTQLASLNKQTWYFADRHEYHIAFENDSSVKIADFKVEDYPRLESLDEAIKKCWNLKSLHCISDNVDEFKEFDSNPVLNTDLTAFVRSKVKYLRRIMKHFRCSDIKRKFDQLHTLKVLFAPKMVIRVSLIRGQIGATVNGQPITPLALYKEKKSEVAFYVRSDCLNIELRSALAEQLYRFSQMDNDVVNHLFLQVLLWDNEQVLYDMLAKIKVRGYEDIMYQPLPIQLEIVLPEAETRGAALGTVINDQSPPNQTEPAEEKLKTMCPEASIASAGILAKENTHPRQTHQQPVSSASPAARPSKIQSRPDSRVVFSTGSSIEVIAGSDPAMFKKSVQDHRSLHVGFGYLNPSSTSTHISTSKQQERSHSSRSDSSRERPQKACNGTPHSLNVGPASSSLRLPIIKSETEQRREQKVGAQGELFVYNLLQEILQVDFPGEDCWTSELRSLAGHGFTTWTPVNPDGNYADFTVEDRQGKLTGWLSREHDVVVTTEAQKRTRITYHIEVKSTTGPCDEVFHLSNVQMQMAEAFSLRESREDVFLLFRVFDVDAPAGSRVRVYGDPFAMMQDGRLLVQANGWLVRENANGIREVY